MSSSTYHILRSFKAMLYSLMISFLAGFILVGSSDAWAKEIPSNTSTATRFEIASWPDERCAYVKEIVRGELPSRGKEVGKLGMEIYFHDMPSTPVLNSEYFYLLENGTYRVKTVLRPDGRFYLVKAENTCEPLIDPEKIVPPIEPKAPKPEPKNYQIVPKDKVMPPSPPQLIRPPRFFAGFFYILSHIFGTIYKILYKCS